VYLAHGNYGFAAAAQFYFGKPVTDLKLQEAALLAGMVNGPKFSPLTNPELALNRRNLVLHRMEEEGKITPAEEASTRKSPLALHIQYPRNDSRLTSSKKIRKYLESTYGTEAVHERGLRVYTTLNISLQRIANQSLWTVCTATNAATAGGAIFPTSCAIISASSRPTKTTIGAMRSQKGSYVTGLVLS